MDETQKYLVKLGDNKEIQLAGKGSVGVKIGNGEIKLIHNVQFVPKLAYNLLSVGQLMYNGYHLVFGNGKCRIMDEKDRCSIDGCEAEQKQFIPCWIHTTWTIKCCYIKWRKFSIVAWKVWSSELSKSSSIKLEKDGYWPA